VSSDKNIDILQRSCVKINFLTVSSFYLIVEKMRIEDLKINDSFNELIAKVINKSAPKEIEFFNINRTVCNYILEDGTGEAILVLYDENIQKISENDIVAITDGNCKIYKGDLQISVEKGTIKTIFEDFFEEKVSCQMKPFLTIMEEALVSENPETRKKACEILGKKRKATRKGIKILDTLLNDQTCCEFARTAMIEIAKEDNLFYFNYLISQDPKIRKLARQTVMNIETMKESLEIIFKSNNEEIIEETLSNLDRFSNGIIRSILDSALQHENDLVRIAAKNEIEKIERQKKKLEEEEEKRKQLTDTFTAI